MNDSALDAEAGLLAPPDHPYPGLRPFTREEWRIFFGRESMIQDVVSRLVSHQLVAVHGDSGCGKSSLIAAGVMPFLERDQARVRGRWWTTIMRPEDRPLINLAEALAGEKGKADPRRVLDLLRLLNRGEAAPAAIARFLDCDAGNNICILFDQFEELFEHARRHGNEEAELITEFLVGLAAEKPKGLHAILTMRSDYLGQCAHYRGFAETVNETQYLVPRMERPALMRAIGEPAALCGGSVDSDLAARLIADAGSGQDQLPLIQHGLMLMWRKAMKAGDPPALTLNDYQAGGDLTAQLSRHADEIMAEAMRGPNEEPVAEALFRALTERKPDGQAIRRRQTFGNLLALTGAPREAVARIVDRFRAPDASFLRPFGVASLGDDDEIDISHEAFIRNWGRISDPGTGWLDREAEDGLIWTSLRLDAADFEKDASKHLSAAAAHERNQWLATRNEAWAARHGGGWKSVSAFVAESVKAARTATRRRRFIFYGAIAAALTCAALAVVAGLQTMEAQRLAAVADEQSRIAAERAEEQQRLAEEAQRLAKEAEHQRIEAQQQKAEADRQRAEAEHQRAEAERQRAEAERQRAEAERQRADAEAKAKQAKATEAVYLAVMSRLALSDGLPTTAVKMALAAWPRAGDTQRPQLRQAVAGLARAFHDFRETLLIRDHVQDVRSAAFSADGGRFVTASFDKTASVWDAITGAEIARFKGQDTDLLCTDFSPDGTRVVTGTRDGTGWIWDAWNGDPIIPMNGHTGPLWAVAYSPDGMRIATASQDKTARIWDAQTGQPLFVLDLHTEPIWSVEFSQDSKFVVTASSDKTVRLWDVATGKQVSQIDNGTLEVFWATLSHDGQHVASASSDGSIQMRKVANGELVKEFRSHRDPVYSVKFSPDDAYLATGSLDNTARIWDVASGSELLTLRGHNSTVSEVDFSPDGKRLLTASWDHTARVWNTEIPKPELVLYDTDQAVIMAAFSPDDSQILGPLGDGPVRLWNSATGAELRTLKGHEGAVWSAAYSRDGKLIVTASADKTARIWDVATGSQIRVLNGHTGAVNSAAFSPDGTRVATGSADGTVRVWDASNGAELLSLPHDGPVISVAFSPDGTSFLTVSKSELFLRDAKTGSIVRSIVDKEYIRSAVFSPDGKYVLTASADQTARIRNALTGAEIVVMIGHESDVQSAAFSADGTRIATASRDGSLRIWDSITGAELQMLPAFNGTVWSAAISNDGMFAISVDTAARVWNISKIGKGDAFEIACIRLGNNTGLQEVEQVYGLAGLPPICGDHAPLPVDLDKLQ